MNSDASTAYQAGQMVGMIVIGLLCVGTLVFFIVALVKAFTRKTTGWIITAVAMGLLGAVMVVAAASSAVMSISRKASENGAITKVLKSKDNKYEIKVPTSWKQMPDLNPQADIVAGNVFNEQYSMVLIEEKSELKMDLATYMTSTSDRMESILTGGKQGATTTLSISGQPAIRRSITGKTEGVNIAYLHTCVETEEHFVQIICWTLIGREAKAFPTFEQVAATFGPTGTPAPPAKGAAAKRSAAPADHVREIMVEQLGIDRAKIADSSRLKEDLGADELDVVELVMAIEEEFQVSVSDETAEKWKSPGDIIRWLETNAPTKN